MSQIVTLARCEIRGLHIKKVGTFDVGAVWTIDSIPEALIKKVQAKETALNPQGKKSRLVSFMTPHGAWIGIEDAYIPKFGIGKPPIDAEVYESSKKTRSKSSETADETQAEEEVTEETAVKKKKKKVAEEEEVVEEAAEETEVVEEEEAKEEVEETEESKPSRKKKRSKRSE